MSAALYGIRIIDMTHNRVSPACGQILVFLGPDVIKLDGRPPAATSNQPDSGRATDADVQAEEDPAKERAGQLFTC